MRGLPAIVLVSPERGDFLLDEFGRYARDYRLETAVSMSDALAAPNLVARGARFNGEVTKFTPEMLSALRAMGIDLKPGQGEDSGVHGVLIRDGNVDGGYDPRREGVVLLLAR